MPTHSCQLGPTTTTAMNTNTAVRSSVASSRCRAPDRGTFAGCTVRQPRRVVPATRSTPAPCAPPAPPARRSPRRSPMRRSAGCSPPARADPSTIFCTAQAPISDAMTKSAPRSQRSCMLCCRCAPQRPRAPATSGTTVHRAQRPRSLRTAGAELIPPSTATPTTNPPTASSPASESTTPSTAMAMVRTAGGGSAWPLTDCTARIPRASPAISSSSVSEPTIERRKLPSTRMRASSGDRVARRTGSARLTASSQRVPGKRHVQEWSPGAAASTPASLTCFTLADCTLPPEAPPRVVPHGRPPRPPRSPRPGRHPRCPARAA